MGSQLSREGGREGGREDGRRKGGRKRPRMGSKWSGGREGGRERGREGGMDWGKGRREGGREGGRGVPFTPLAVSLRGATTPLSLLRATWSIKAAVGREMEITMKREKEGLRG